MDFYFYPNPASDYAIFGTDNSLITARVELIDKQGRKVLSGVLSGQKKVFVNQLKYGIYFYKVIVNKKLYNGRLVIK